MLEQEREPYSDIIEEIENAPLTQRVIKRGTAKYRIEITLSAYTKMGSRKTEVTGG